MITVLTARSFQGGYFTCEIKGRSYYLKRDKEIVRNVLGSKAVALGLAGSDAVNEDRCQDVNTEVLLPIVNKNGQRLRFGLAVRNNKADVDVVRGKIQSGEPLRIATSYPRTAIAELGRSAISISINPLHVQSGGVEALAWQYKDDTDAIFELISTGNSIVQNRLVILEDNITPVNLLLVTNQN